MTERALTGKIVQAKSPREVLDIIAVYASEFNEIHAATCLYQIAQQRHKLSKADAESPLLRDLVDFLEWQTSRMVPYTLANTAWSAAQLRRKMGQRVLKLMPSIAEQSALIVDQFSPRHLANLAWAFATVGHKEAKLFQKIAAAFVSRMHDTDAQNLSNMAWSFAALGIINEELMNAIASRAIRIIEEFQAQNLSNLAWSLAKLGILRNGLMDAIANRAVTVIHTFPPQAIANLVWSFAKLGVMHPKLMSAVADRAIETIDAFSSQNVANTAWALSKLGIRDAGLMNVLANRVRTTIHTSNAQALANFAWAYWWSGAQDCAVARDICSTMQQVSKDTRKDGNLVLNWALVMSLAAAAGATDEPLTKACAVTLLQPGLLSKASDYSISALTRLSEIEDWSSAAPELCAAVAQQVQKRKISRAALDSNLIAEPSRWSAEFR